MNILITRPLRRLRDACAILSEKWFEIHPCPTIRICPVGRNPDLDEIFSQIPAFDFAIFTSPVAVVKTADYLHALGLGLEHLKQICVCAVGPITAGNLNHYGIKADVVPNKYTAQALADLFPTMHTHAPKVLFPRGNMASQVLPAELSRKGYEVISPIVYITEPRKHLDIHAKHLIDNKDVDCIAFTSPSSVTALKSILGESSFERLSGTAEIAAIGPITSAACTSAGLEVSIQPDEYTLSALAREIAHHFDTPSDASNR